MATALTDQLPLTTDPLSALAVAPGSPSGGFDHDRDTDNGKEEWLTPPEIIRALGDFDLDPCSPVAAKRPWPTARHHFTIEDNGLIRPWEGRVWCNPPYGPKTSEWLGRCAEHGNCVVLIFARTETRAFFDHVWPKADAVLFLRGRISFYHVTGKPGGTAGAPSMLVAYGAANAHALKTCGLDGHFLSLENEKLSDKREDGHG